MNKKRKGFVIAIVSSCLLVPGAALHFTAVHLLGDFLLSIGISYLILCAVIFFGQKHVVHCPSCGYGVIGARKKVEQTGMAKCPICGALVFVKQNK